MNTDRREAYVDGLRAIAVLSVAIFHAGVHVRSLSGPATYSLAEQWGSQGVNLFFVLSGFCLSYAALRAFRAGTGARLDVARYALKRLWRIYPPYVAATLVSIAVVATARLHGIALPTVFHPPGDAGDLFSQLAFLDAHPAWVNPSFWSLAIEFRWYFAFPFALALFIRSPRAFGTLAIGAAIAAAATQLGSTHDFARLPGFLLGIVAADVALRGGPAWRWAVPGAVASLALAIVQSRTDPVFQGDALGWQLLCFCLVCAAGSLPRARLALAWRPLAAIGTASYSIYLVHEPIVAIAAHGMPAFAVTPFGVPAFVALAVATGALFHVCVERPLSQPWIVASIERRVKSRIVAMLDVAGVPHDVRLARAESPAAIAPVPLAGITPFKPILASVPPRETSRARSA